MPIIMVMWQLTFLLIVVLVMIMKKNKHGDKVINLIMVMITN